jgi:hypothetical protein
MSVGPSFSWPTTKYGMRVPSSELAKYCRVDSPPAS